MNFTVYSKDGCPYCEKIKEVLELGNFQFVEYKLNEHFTDLSFMRNLEEMQLSLKLRLTDKKWVDVQKLLNTSENTTWSNG